MVCGSANCARALKNLNVVAAKLRANDFGFAGDDAADAEGKILDGDFVFAAIIVAVKSFHGVAGQLKDGFADALAGNRAGMHADAADHERAVNDRDALAKFRGADRALLARRAAADHDEVKLSLRHALTYLSCRVISEMGIARRGRVTRVPLSVLDVDQTPISTHGRGQSASQDD